MMAKPCQMPKKHTIAQILSHLNYMLIMIFKKTKPIFIVESQKPESINPRSPAIVSYP